MCLLHFDLWHACTVKQIVALCASHTEYQWFMAFMEVHALAIRMEKAAFNLLLTSFVAGQVSVSHPLGEQQQLVKKASSRGKVPIGPWPHTRKYGYARLARYPVHRQFVTSPGCTFMTIFACVGQCVVCILKKICYKKLLFLRWSPGDHFHALEFTVAGKKPCALAFHHVRTCGCTHCKLAMSTCLNLPKKYATCMKFNVWCFCLKYALLGYFSWFMNSHTSIGAIFKI